MNKKYQEPQYVFIRREPNSTTIYGEIENSFSMGDSIQYVRVYNKSDLNFSNLLLKDNYFIARLRSKNCPITVDIPQIESNHKFYRRNKRFILK